MWVGVYVYVYVFVCISVYVGVRERVRVCMHNDLRPCAPKTLCDVMEDGEGEPEAATAAVSSTCLHACTRARVRLRACMRLRACKCAYKCV